jgi:competence protein ComEC
MRELLAGLWRSIRLLPLLVLSIFFLAGMALARHTSSDPILWAALAFLALAAWWLWRGSELRTLGLPMGEVAYAALLLMALFLGAGRYELNQSAPTPADTAYYNDAGYVTLVGTIVRPPVRHDSYVEVVIQAERLEPAIGERQPLGGRLLARLSSDVEWRYGDRLRLTGQLEAPPSGEDFDYRLYLARYGIHSQMAFPDSFLIQHDAGNPLLASLFAIRQRGVPVLYRLYPAPEAALLSGILLGDETGLSDRQKQDYNDSGLRHIIAISGFNISIIAGLLYGLFSQWWGRGRGAWLAAAGIGLYTILVGGDAAVLRAALMGGLALYARQVGRRQDGLTSLAVTGALMALVNPLLLWDVGFQLSFAATLGIILYADPLQARLDRWLEPRVAESRRSALSAAASEYLLITLAAQVTTLPLLLYHFQRLSLISFPANLLVLPVQPALMVAGGLSLMLGMAALPLGRLLSMAAWPLAAFSNRMADWFASLCPAQLIRWRPLALLGWSPFMHCFLPPRSPGIGCGRDCRAPALLSP